MKYTLEFNEELNRLRGLWFAVTYYQLQIKIFFGNIKKKIWHDKWQEWIKEIAVGFCRLLGLVNGFNPFIKSQNNVTRLLFYNEIVN